MMIKILCLLQTSKVNVKNVAIMLLHDLKGIHEKGGRAQLNARGSTCNLTSLIEKKLTLQCKIMIKILCLLQTAKFNVKNIAFMLLHDLKGIHKKGWSHPT